MRASQVIKECCRKCTWDAITNQDELKTAPILNRSAVRFHSEQPLKDAVCCAGAFRKIENLENFAVHPHQTQRYDRPASKSDQTR